MASSRSFSCSSWGDCCVVGWRKTETKQNRIQWSCLCLDYNGIPTLQNALQVTLQCDHSSLVRNSCVTCNGESSSTLQKPEGSYRYPASTTASGQQSHRGTAGPTFPFQHLEVKNPVQVSGKKSSKRMQRQDRADRKHCCCFCPRASKHVQSTHCNCTDALCAHKSQVPNCYRSCHSIQDKILISKG